MCAALTHLPLNVPAQHRLIETSRTTVSCDSVSPAMPGAGTTVINKLLLKKGKLGLELIRNTTKSDLSSPMLNTS